MRAQGVGAGARRERLQLSALGPRLGWSWQVRHGRRSEGGLGASQIVRARRRWTHWRVRCQQRPCAVKYTVAGSEASAAEGAAGGPGAGRGAGRMSGSAAGSTGVASARRRRRSRVRAWARAARSASAIAASMSWMARAILASRRRSAEIIFNIQYLTQNGVVRQIEKALYRWMQRERSERQRKSRIRPSTISATCLPQFKNLRIWSLCR